MHTHTLMDMYKMYSISIDVHFNEDVFDIIKTI